MSKYNKYLKIGLETVGVNAKKKTSLWSTIRKRYQTYYPDPRILVFKTNDPYKHEKMIHESLREFRKGKHEHFVCSIGLAIKEILEVIFGNKFSNHNLEKDATDPKNIDYEKSCEVLDSDIIFIDRGSEDPIKIPKKVLDALHDQFEESVKKTPSPVTGDKTTKVVGEKDFANYKLCDPSLVKKVSHHGKFNEKSLFDFSRKDDIPFY